MYLQPATPEQSNRFGIHTASLPEKFRIYHGKANAKIGLDDESRRLAIQYVVYDTLVKGIHSAIRQPDFKGALITDYELNGEQYHIVFAMWYSRLSHIYFLTSLGQYSTRDFLRRMRHFKVANESRLTIKLAPIHPQGLANLMEKLLRSNLSGANVCLLEDTIEPSNCLALDQST